MVTVTMSNDENMTVTIYGEIDHHTARGIREELDLRIERATPKILTFDFTNVTFMDSSGIGLIIGRYKLMSAIGGKIVISNTSQSINRVMQLSGISKLAEII